MKAFRFKAIAAVVLTLAILAGCSGGGSKPSEQTPAQKEPAKSEPAKPKTLTIAGGTNATSMDIHKVSDSPSFSILEHINETLFTMSPTGEIKPNLAESFTANPDGKSYTIKLRSGIKFSDGTPFNAEAVKLNFERVLKPETKAAFRSLIALVTKVETPDELTVVLHTSKPFAPLQFHLTHSGVGIIAPSALAKGDDWLATNTIGTGPYTLKEFKKDQSTTLVKNPNYWGTPAKIDEVTYKAVKEAGPRLVEVESGAADIATNVPANDVARLKANPDIDVTTVPGLRILYVMFNNQKPPFNDVRVRQAINYGVDKEAIVKNLLGGAGRVLDAPMAEPIFGYSKQTPYARDVAKARQLLADAGIKPGTKITLHHPTGRYAQDAKVAEAIAAQLKEIGLEVELKTLEWAQYLAFTAKPSAESEMQMAMLGWSTPTMDADYALYNLFHSSLWPDKNGFNRSFYKNPQVDALLEKGQTTVDPAQRKAAYAEAIKLIWQDAPWLFLHSETQLTAVRKNVTGFVTHPSERIVWTNADKK
ncbi:MAG: glutathione ABC transporter substrate-binding protein [Bacillota bacterium]